MCREKKTDTYVDVVDYRGGIEVGKYNYYIEGGRMFETFERTVNSVIYSGALSSFKICQSCFLSSRAVLRRSTVTIALSPSENWREEREAAFHI